MSALSSGSLTAAITASAAVVTNLVTMISVQIDWLPGFTAYLMISIAASMWISFAIFRFRDAMRVLYSANEFRRALGLPPVLPQNTTSVRILALVYSARPAQTIKSHPMGGYDQHAV